MATKLNLTSGVVWVLNDIDLNLKTLTTTRAGIATTSTDGLILTNTTASTAAIPVQQSPRIRLRSNVWNTTVTAANNTDDWIIESVPVSGTTPAGLLKFGKSLNGGAYTFPMTLTSGGIATFLGEVRPGDNLKLPAAGQIYWTGRTSFRASADGKLEFTNNAESVGVGLDASVENIFKVRTRAQTGYATVDALAYRINGSGGATSLGRVTKKVTGIADNAATTVFTVTVPNANHAASIKLRFLSSNGGADAFESARTAEGTVVLTRTTGVTTVATAVAISDEAIATVAAGATHTLAYSATAMTGAAGAEQTFDIQVTIDDSGNLGSNQVVASAELLNAEATGVTIA